MLSPLFFSSFSLYSHFKKQKITSTWASLGKPDSFYHEVFITLSLFMKIWLVGSTNVGKSTLFNRLIGQFRAIVTDIPGTTRDILHHNTHLDHIGEVTFLDSPGLLDFQEEWGYIQKIINEADLLLFVIDDTIGITAKEQHILWYIMDKNKKKCTNQLWKECHTIGPGIGGLWNSLGGLRNSLFLDTTEVDDGGSAFWSGILERRVRLRQETANLQHHAAARGPAGTSPRSMMRSPSATSAARRRLR